MSYISCRIFLKLSPVNSKSCRFVYASVLDSDDRSSHHINHYFDHIPCPCFFYPIMSCIIYPIANRQSPTINSKRYIHHQILTLKLWAVKASLAANKEASVTAKYFILYIYISKSRIEVSNQSKEPFHQNNIIAARFHPSEIQSVQSWPLKSAYLSILFKLGDNYYPYHDGVWWFFWRPCFDIIRTVSRYVRYHSFNTHNVCRHM